MPMLFCLGRKDSQRLCGMLFGVEMNNIEISINGQDLTHDEYMVLSIALSKYLVMLKTQQEEVRGGKKVSFDESYCRYHMDILEGIFKKWKNL